MKLKTIFYALTCLTLAVPQAYSADITVKVLYQGNHPEIYEPLAQAFMAKQSNIALDLIRGDGNYEGIMQTLLRNKIVGDVPDVSFLGFDFMRMTADTGAGVPLNSFIANEPDMDKAGYVEKLSGLCKQGDYVLGMPFAISMPVIYYNLDLLKRAGADTSDLDYTWDQITDYSKKIAALGGNNQGMYLSYDASSNWMLKSLIESVGGSMMNADDTEIQFGNEKGEWAFGILNKIGESGYANVSRNQAKQSFGAGTLGILVDSSSDVANQIDITKDVFKMGVGPFPVPNAEGRLPAGGNCVVMTTEDPERQKAAWEFIKFVTSAEGQTILAGTSGYVPNNRLALEGKGAIGELYATNPNYQVAVKELAYAGPSYAFPGKNSARISDAITDYMRRILVNEIEPNEMLPAMRTDVEALLKN